MTLASAKVSGCSRPVPSSFLTLSCASRLSPYNGERSRYDDVRLILTSLGSVLNREWMTRLANEKNKEDMPLG